MFYQTTVVLPVSRMKALISLLEKVEIQAKEKNMSDADVLARLTGKGAPKMEDSEPTLAYLRTPLESTTAYVESFSEEDFSDAATTEIRISYFPGLHMVGQDYVTGYALPNFFFHVVTVYSIFRHHGFDVGKSDYMGKNVPFIADVA